jgi:hypothetical protein
MRQPATRSLASRFFVPQPEDAQRTMHLPGYKLQSGTQITEFTANRQQSAG